MDQNEAERETSAQPASEAAVALATAMQRNAAGWAESHAQADVDSSNTA